MKLRLIDLAQLALLALYLAWFLGDCLDLIRT